MYRDYLLSLKKNKSKMILVDVSGSGQSFCYFIDKFNIKDIEILFFNIAPEIKSNKNINYYNYHKKKKYSSMSDMWNASRIII